MNTIELFRKIMKKETFENETFKMLVAKFSSQIVEQCLELSKLDFETLTLSQPEHAKLLKVLAENNLTRHGLNLDLYAKLLPFTRLACKIEHNNNPELHAAKLAILFNSLDDVFNYLEKFEQANLKRRQLLHDACLFSIPEGNWDIKLWQSLVKEHLLDDQFVRLLPYAGKIEDYVKKNRKELEKEISENFMRELELKLSMEYDKTQREFNLRFKPKVDVALKQDENKLQEEAKAKLDLDLKKKNNLPLTDKLTAEQVKMIEALQKAPGYQTELKNIYEKLKSEHAQSLEKKFYLEEAIINNESKLKNEASKKLDLLIKQKNNIPLYGKPNNDQIQLIKKLQKTPENQKRLKDIYEKLKVEFSQKFEKKHRSEDFNREKNGYIKEYFAQNAKTIQANCASKFPNILSANTPVSALARYAVDCYERGKENKETADQFFKYGLGEKEFNQYLQLKPQDDPSQVPELMIEGTEIDPAYEGYYIKKLNSRDPRAACLGKMTSCCQSLGSEGEKVTIFGIESPSAGFYVLCKRAGTKQSDEDVIVAQALAWRGQTGKLILDSIESQVNFRENHHTVLTHFYLYLAHKLVRTSSISQVRVGIGETPADFKVIDCHHLGYEFPKNYYQGRDSLNQYIIADKKIPFALHLADVLDLRALTTISSKESLDPKMSLKDYYLFEDLVGLGETSRGPRPTKSIPKNDTDQKGKMDKEKLNLFKELQTLVKYNIEESLARYMALEDLRIELGKLLYSTTSASERLEILKRCILAGKHPDWLFFVAGKIHTSLMYASREGDLESLRFLLKQGANPDIQDWSGNTALMLACLGGFFDLVKELHQQGANINLKDTGGTTAITMAASKEHWDIVKYLAENDAELDKILFELLSENLKALEKSTDPKDIATLQMLKSLEKLLMEKEKSKSEALEKAKASSLHFQHAKQQSKDVKQEASVAAAKQETGAAAAKQKDDSKTHMIMPNKAKPKK